MPNLILTNVIVGSPSLVTPKGEYKSYSIYILLNKESEQYLKVKKLVDSLVTVKLNGIMPKKLTPDGKTRDKCPLYDLAPEAQTDNYQACLNAYSRKPVEVTLSDGSVAPDASIITDNCICHVDVDIYAYAQNGGGISCSLEGIGLVEKREPRPSGRSKEEKRSAMKQAFAQAKNS